MLTYPTRASRGCGFVYYNATPSAGVAMI